jgi:hypothetical protein
MGTWWEYYGILWDFSLEYIGMIKGSLVRKLPNYERLSWLAFSPWWQPHHHASSWEVWEIGNTWIQAWKRTRMRNPVFFRVKWLPWSPKEGLCFRGFAARSVQVCLQNGTWNNNNNLEESGGNGEQVWTS